MSDLRWGRLRVPRILRVTPPLWMRHLVPWSAIEALCRCILEAA